MRALTKASLVLCLSLAAGGVTACASSSAAPGAPRVSVDVISEAEIRNVQLPNAYLLVQRLRPQWLRTRTPDTALAQQSELQVRLDDAPMGGVESLRDIGLGDLVEVRFVSPTTAASRWGSAYSYGAIVLSTRR